MKWLIKYFKFMNSKIYEFLNQYKRKFNLKILIINDLPNLTVFKIKGFCLLKFRKRNNRRKYE